MNWFRNAKFQSKFFFAFGLLLSFAVILAVFAIITINNVETAFERLAAGPNQRLVYASDAAAEFAEARRHILSMSYMGTDIEHINSSYEQYRQNAVLVLLYLDMYHLNFINDPLLSEEEIESRQVIITNIKDAFSGKYQKNAYELFQAAAAFDKQRVDELVTEAAPLGNELTDALLSLRTMVQGHLEDITVKTQREANEAITLLIVIAVFILILSLITSILMASALKVPIVEMEASMAEIAKGNLSYPIRSDRKDELGMLSNHIGDMVDTISMLNKAVAIVDNVDGMIFATDLDYNLIFVNQKTEEIFNISRDDCIGQKCYKILDGGSDKICDICPLPYLLQNKESLPYRDWERHYVIGGKDTWYTCKTSISKWVDGSLVAISTCKDDTLRKQHEEQQARHAEELRMAAIAAEEASRAKSTFLANMSHEIRTPMNAVMGMSELILRKNLPQDAYENALGIRSASQNLLTIINDILDFSKIESGMLEIVEDEYRFSSLINDVIGIVRIRLMDKPVQFIVDIDPKLPETLLGDEIRIRQLLINLLGNAVKYTAKGSIHMTVACENYEVETLMTVSISDTGIGIKEEDLAKLFEDFVQIDVAKNKGVEGTGLGLAISRSLCHAMGGDISVESEYGKGSKFTFTLPQKFEKYKPFAEVDDPSEKSVLIYETRELYRNAVINALEQLGVCYKNVNNISELFDNLGNYPFSIVSSFAYGSIKPTLIKLTNQPKLILLAEVTDMFSPKDARVLSLPAHSLSIANALNGVDEIHSDSSVLGASFIAPDASLLIVDDITANLKVAEGFMAPFEMNITICKSGLEAIELIEANRYDLVFMDHMMPEMDGIEATRLIREKDGDYYKKLPIIALTANAVSGVREMFVQNGMNDFLAKPIEAAKLNAILEKWVPQEKKKKATVQPIEESAFVDTLKSVKGLYVDKAIAVMGGAPKTYERIFKLSVKLLPENIESLNKLIDSDLPDYAIEIHGVKGVLNNIGAYKLGKSALTLEELSNCGDVDACKSLHADFMEELTGFLDEAAALISTADVPEKQPNDKSYISENIQKLEQAMDFFDAVFALEILSDMRKYAYGQKIDVILADLTHSLELFDFDKALGLTEILKGELTPDE